MERSRRPRAWRASASWLHAGHALALLVFLVLPANSEAQDQPGGCIAGPVQRFRGEPFSPALMELARQMSRSALVRKLDPDALPTMDYRRDRLNVHVDARGLVEKLVCG